MNNRRRHIWWLLAIAMVAAACGDGSGEGSDTTAGSSDTTVPA